MSGAAVNIIPAPWFERRRGLAVSVAFNGATLGGVTLMPALYPGGRRRSGGRSWDEERSSEKARSVNRAFILSRLTRYGGSEWRRLK
jgi:hypothetical protein